jgi:hypothetical protein
VLRGLPFDEHDRLAVMLEHDSQHDSGAQGGERGSIGGVAE